MPTGPATPEQYGQGFAMLKGSYATDGKGNYTELSGSFYSTVNDDGCKWVVEYLNHHDQWSPIWPNHRFTVEFAISKFRSWKDNHIYDHLDHVRVRHLGTGEIIPWEVL